MGNVVSAIAYLFGWISGLVVYLVAKEDRLVRFHGLQSILLDLVLVLIVVVVATAVFVITFLVTYAAFWLDLYVLGAFLPVIGTVVMFLPFLPVFLIRLWMMWQAYNGSMYKLPAIGGLAEGWSR